MKTNPNDPVTPSTRDSLATEALSGQKPGLTKREHFASLAMQGLVIHYSKFVDCNFATTPKDTAKMAVEYADALIEELNKGKE